MAFVPGSKSRSTSLSVSAVSTPSANWRMPRSFNENRSATTFTLFLIRSEMTLLYFDPLRAGRTPFCTRNKVASLPRLAIPWTSSAKYSESELSKGSIDSIIRYFAIGRPPVRFYVCLPFQHVKNPHHGHGLSLVDSFFHRPLVASPEMTLFCREALPVLGYLQGSLRTFADHRVDHGRLSPSSRLKRELPQAHFGEAGNHRIHRLALLNRDIFHL